MESAFVKTTNKKALLYAAIAVAVGVGVILAGSIGGFTLSIRRLELPVWVMYIAGAIVIGIGILIAWMGLDSRKCTKCGALGTNEEAYFPLELEKAVVQAVEALNVPALSDMPKVPKNQMKTVVYVHYCTGCGEVAEVEVGKWENYQPHDILPSRVVTGQQALAFRELARSHADWRGEDSE